MTANVWATHDNDLRDFWRGCWPFAENSGNSESVIDGLVNRAVASPSLFKDLTRADILTEARNFVSVDS